MAADTLEHFEGENILKMRKVTYFHAGTVADFAIPDDRFDEFTKAMTWEKSHSEDEIQKARAVLGDFMMADVVPAVGPGHILAACYIWNFFNTNPDEEMHIAGDIVVIDLEGNGAHIDYSAASDINISPEN